MSTPPPRSSHPPSLPIPPSASSSSTNSTVHVLPRIDERCLTLCSQRSNARVFQSPPACHTLCWRKIWAYERQLIDAASQRGRLTLNVPAPVQVKGGEEARALNARFGEERQRLQVLARLHPPSKEENSPGHRALGPFAPPPSSWPLLRGHFIYYARGPRRAAEHTSSSMRHLGLGNMWVAKTGAGAVLPKASEVNEGRGRAVGLGQLAGEEERARGEEEKWDPDYAVLISLEHLPPSVYSALSRTLERVYNPLRALLTRYRESFSSGQQGKTARLLWERAWDGEAGAWGVLKRFRDDVRREVERREKEEEEEKKKGRGTGGA
ncbi:hypothetical protein CALVIDRAFT_598485 [Calocera viscosa TUFC12733]|uniref:Uncharacterized protein n=1 Tax=Calocera viscosa (strain TUFC12733) TaxID=1330018 RepID=A0A167LY96_CALVF|nr:hypothetical protein CALVIDRAFT_598485 [Calocera viscosa TUFC12733]